MKKTILSIAAVAVLTMAGASAGLAAELPGYEANGLPISAVQVQALGAANVRQQSAVPASALSPHQLSVLTPRANLTTATVTPARAETTGRAVR